jgi:hypothetical protein
VRIIHARGTEAQGSQSLIWKCAPEFETRHGEQGEVMGSRLFGVKRERGDGESKGEMKQPMTVKKEEAEEVGAPKIARRMGESLSDIPVPLRRINLAAGRLPGQNADGTWLGWPEWCDGRRYTPMTASLMKEQFKIEEAVNTEASAKESKMCIWDDEDDLAEDAAPYDTLRPVLTKLLKPKRCYTMDKFISCPFCLEGLAVIEGRLGPQVYRPLARSLEWPESARNQQGQTRCETRCPRKMKKGWQGLYAHARDEGRVVPDEEGVKDQTLAELHQLLYQVMDNVSANPTWAKPLIRCVSQR